MHGFPVTKRRDIKSTFDVFSFFPPFFPFFPVFFFSFEKNAQLSLVVHKKRVSINFLIITLASKGVLIEFCQWTYFVCK